MLLLKTPYTPIGATHCPFAASYLCRTLQAEINAIKNEKNNNHIHCSCAYVSFNMLW